MRASRKKKKTEAKEAMERMSAAATEKSTAAEVKESSGGLTQAEKSFQKMQEKRVSRIK